MSLSIKNEDAFEAIRTIDNRLSSRSIQLDPKGYFLIKLNRECKELVVEHYYNDIDQSGRAIDPETGDLIGCKDRQSRQPEHIYKGRTAKEVGIALTEGTKPYQISKLDHAMYLGRELQKAEQCLISGAKYIQD